MNATPRPDLRTRTQALLLLGTVFAAGFGAGAAVSHLTASPGEEPARSPARHLILVGEDPHQPPRGFSIRGRTGPGVEERLELDPAQSERLEQILDRRRTEIEATLDRIEPLLRAQMDSTDREIYSLLTPDQRAAFDRVTELRGSGDLPGSIRIRLVGPPHRGGPGGAAGEALPP